MDDEQPVDALPRKDALQALETGTGAGVKIAVLDSGIEIGHPDLKGLAIEDDIAIEEDGVMTVPKKSDGTDVFGHGTAIAGILHTIAPEATIGSFRVLGGKLQSKTAIIGAGVAAAIERGYQILNCSFGCRGDVKFIMPYKNFVDRCYLRDIHLVAGCNNYDFTKTEWPGHFPTAITVNMARSKSGESFYYRPGQLVEFAAAGEGVSVPWRDGERKSVTGSSYAAPLVAGMVARILSVHPELSSLAMKETLRRIARPWQDELAGINDKQRRRRRRPSSS